MLVAGKVVSTETKAVRKLFHECNVVVKNRLAAMLLRFSYLWAGPTTVLKLVNSAKSPWPLSACAGSPRRPAVYS